MLGQQYALRLTARTGLKPLQPPVLFDTLNPRIRLPVLENATGANLDVGRVDHMGSRFVGFGIGNYQSGLATLRSPRSVANVREALRNGFARVGLGDVFGSNILIDPDGDTTEEGVRDQLRAVKRLFTDGASVPSESDQALVVMWSGHGKAAPGNGGVRLFARNSDNDFVSGLTPADLVGPCVVSGANQVLLIVEACFSGGALEATQLANQLFELRKDGGENAWFGVLAACRSQESASDGVFADAIRMLLRDGPSDNELRRRWSVHNRLIRGDDFCDGLIKGWSSHVEQLPRYQCSGNAFGMVPNPLWNPDAPAQVVEHLLLAARGGDVADDTAWFTGRTAEVNEVVSWVRSGRPGVRVVTGSAGTGKSAIVGRVVSASVESERQNLLRQGPLGHDDPGPGSITAHAHARGLTPKQLARVLTTGLVRAGFLAPDTRAADSNVNLLLGALERRAQEKGDRWHRPVVVIDGLDEARDQALMIASDLLVRLGQWATVIVATRNLPGSGEGPDLLGTLGVGDRIDLDDPMVVETGRVAMRDYVVSRLAGVSTTMDPATVADYFVAQSGPIHGPAFLIARLMTAQLRSEPVDTTVARWQDHVSTSVAQAFEHDLASVAAPSHVTGSTTLATSRAKDLLTALTWGVGAGVPEDVWVVIAAAAAVTGIADARDEISWVLASLGRYIVEDGSEGSAVYRVAHQSLADHLRPGFQPTAATPFDPRATHVAHALLDHYDAELRTGRSVSGPRYLWRYGWRHAASAGLDGLDRLRELADKWPGLTGDLAMAIDEVSATLAGVGRHADAVAPAEEAVERYQGLAGENAAFLPDLARALNNLGVRYSGVGRRADAVAPVEEAVEWYRGLAGENAALLGDLARALTNLSIYYSGVGRYADAVALAEEAVERCQGLADENAAFLPDLARALNNLGVCYSEVGRCADAVALTEEAVERCQGLAGENAAFLPGLASALNNLGIRYSEVGRYADAVAPAEEAVERYQGLADENAAFLPDLARALNNLGSRYSGVGRYADAVAPAEEAVERYQGLAGENAAFLPDLASALNNLGIRYSEVGRYADAVAPLKEAVERYQGLADENAAFLPDLAGALNNLGVCYSEVGRCADAVAPAEEAVERYQGLAGENAAFLPDLARALNNLGVRYSGVGRYADAVAPAEEAVERYQGLADENAAFLPDLARALNNLGVCYSGVGRYADAVAPLKEAVERYQGLADENAAFLPDLARALNNLGIRYSRVGRYADAVAPAEEAVERYQGLADENAAFLPGLARALNNLSIYYSGVGRYADAVAPTEEAVERYQGLADENAAFLPGLARALNNLSIYYSGVGRCADAVAPAEEAVERYQGLAGENAAFLPYLARALNNLGVCYSEVGRCADAVAPAEEAVERYQGLAGENAAFLPDLASALNNLGVCYSEVGRNGDYAAVWVHCRDSMPPHHHPYLYLRRLDAAGAGDPRAIDWVQAATAGVDGDPSLLAALHSQARRHRVPDPAGFDQAWQAASGNAAPAWLTADQHLVDIAQGWVATKTYTEERDWLTAHPELLDVTADTAIDEALLALPDEEAARYREIRQSARAGNVATAYRPIHLRELAHQFVVADRNEQRRLLAEHGADLRDDVVDDYLAQHAAQDARAAVAQYLILLSRTGDHVRVWAALDEPQSLGEYLADTARIADPPVLAASALVVGGSAPTHAALALLYLGIAHAMSGDSDGATALIASARQLDPSQTGDWINRVASLGAEHPQVLELITVLTSAVEEGETR